MKYDGIEKYMGKIQHILCIQGMNVDQVQYAAQASENAFLVDKENDLCKGEILGINFEDVKEEFYISLSENDFCLLKQKYPKVLKSGQKLYIEFEVKHSYFDTLHKSVISAPISMIRKITPTSCSEVSSSITQSFRLNHECSYSHDLCLDEFQQLEALNMIIQSPPDYPVIVSGPFGTGKTRIVARAAFEFVNNGLQSRKVTRILLCAHHSKTIDTYLSRYLQPVFSQVPGVKIVKVMRRVEHSEPHWNSRNVMSKSIFDFRRDIVLGRHIKDKVLVIITTYTMSLHVANALSHSSTQFTHILLDEAAQVREPEAIAALSLGNSDTKVVIAGDSKQVYLLHNL